MLNLDWKQIYERNKWGKVSVFLIFKGNWFQSLGAADVGYLQVWQRV